MDLERRSIERDDFARARRGYDPEQVQLHLKEIADRVQELQEGRSAVPVADSAAAQVRSIVEAAERIAAELQSKARKEADRIRAEAADIRAEADSEAADARERATGEAAERLGVVHEASARVLDGAEAIERALARMREKVVALGAALEVDSAGADLATDLLAGGDDEARAEARGAESAEQLEADALGPVADEEAGDGGRERAADAQDVRLIALNMALNGSPREETARYLEENFVIDDPGALLDEVYARAGT